eukprot:TRINITY_DN4367_c0_g1_i1.p2 TRINITY_DN4367_c0_g1~~TRINITY_DN4367_c0_g1_i1.p2  ORF type:complete len:835 (-),score=241.70 TRINITY_DN4367_c0_g1_i1:2442-4946(-)
MFSFMRNLKDGEWPTRVVRSGRLPRPRAFHVAVQVGDFMIIAGGDNGTDILGDCQALHLDTFEWRKVKSPPQFVARTGASICSVGSYAYICFGSGNPRDPVEPLQSLWRVNVDVDAGPLQLEKVQVKGDVPPPRAYAAMTAIESDIFVFGGFQLPGCDQELDDLYRFDTETHMWSRVEVETDAEHSVARRGASMFSVDGNLVLIGGRRGKTLCSAVQMLPLASASVSGSVSGSVSAHIPLKWSTVRSVGDPPSPRAFSGCCRMSESSFLVFGGGLAGSKPLGDAYLLKLSLDSVPTAPTATAVRERSEQPVVRAIYGKPAVAGTQLNVFEFDAFDECIAEDRQQQQQQQPSPLAAKTSKPVSGAKPKTTVAKSANKTASAATAVTRTTKTPRPATPVPVAQPVLDLEQDLSQSMDIDEPRLPDPAPDAVPMEQDNVAGVKGEQQQLTNQTHQDTTVSAMTTASYASSAVKPRGRSARSVATEITSSIGSTPAKRVRGKRAREQPIEQQPQPHDDGDELQQQQQQQRVSMTPPAAPSKPNALRHTFDQQQQQQQQHSLQRNVSPDPASKRALIRKSDGASKREQEMRAAELRVRELTSNIDSVSAQSSKRESERVATAELHASETHRETLVQRQRDELRQLSNEVTRLKTEMAKQMSERAAADARSEELERQLHQVTSQYDGSVRDCNKLNQLHDEDLREIDTLRKTLAVVKTDLNDFLEQRRRAVLALDDAEARAVDFEHRLSDTEQRYSTALKELSNAHELCERLKSEVAVKQGTMERMRTEVQSNARQYAQQLCSHALHCTLFDSNFALQPFTQFMRIAEFLQCRAVALLRI